MRGDDGELKMMFWSGIIIALLVAAALMTTNDSYYVRQTNEAFGLVIGAVAITLAFVRLLST